MTDTVKKYLEIYNKIKELELQREELQGQVLDEMDDEHTNQIETKFGWLVQGQRTTYTYSDNIKAMELRLKDLKKQEEVSEVAVVKNYTRFIRFMKPSDKIRFPRIG